MFRNVDVLLVIVFGFFLGGNTCFDNGMSPAISAFSAGAWLIIQDLECLVSLILLIFLVYPQSIVVVSKIARFAYASCIELSIFMIAQFGHFDPAFGMVAIFAHSTSIVCISDMFTLIDLLPVFDLSSSCPTLACSTLRPSCILAWFLLTCRRCS